MSFWRRAIVFCFHFLLLTVPLFFTWFNSELFEFSKMLLTYAVTIVIGTFWICRMVTEKKIFIRRTPFDIPILLFLASQIISTVFSMNIHTSLYGYYTRFNGGLLSFFCYTFLFYAFVSNLQKRDLSKLFLTTFVSAFLVTLMAIPEHFGHAYSCLLINLYRFRNQALPSDWFQQFYNVSCWIQDVQGRVFASFGQPNWLAAYAIVLIPLGIILSITDTFNLNRWTKGFYILTTACLLISLIFTRSRSGILGFAVGMLILGVGFGLVTLRRKKITLISAGTGLILLGVIFTFGTPFTKNYGEAWLQKMVAPTQTPAPSAPPTDETTVNHLETGGTESAAIRKIVWTGALKVWLRYPLFGSGVETFAYSYYQDRPMAHNLVSEWDFLYNKAHNEFLNFLATTGIVGLLTYLLMIGFFTAYPLWVLIKKKPAEPETILFSFALAGGLVALHISNFLGFSTVMVNILLFILPGFFVVQYLPTQMRIWSFSETSSDSNEEDASPLIMSISYLIIFCISVGLLFSVYSMWRADFLFNRGKQYVQINQLMKGIQDMQTASSMSPNESTFDDDLSSAYSRLAIALAQQGNATSAAEAATAAIDTTNRMLTLNPVNLGFYKTQVRVYMNLSQLNPQWLLNAQATLRKAIELAPTDPKLQYYLALVEISVGNTTTGLADLEKTVQMKANYLAARLSLADEYEKENRLSDAKKQYQYILQNIQADEPQATSRLASISATTK